MSEIAAPLSAKAATVLGDDDRFRSPSPPTLPETGATGRQSSDAEREQEQAAKRWLQATWPAAFPPDDRPVRPLAIGAGDVIKAASPIELAVMVERATATWVRSIRYLTAVANGVHRVHLNGDDAGAPDEPHRKHARQRVDKMLARRNRTKTAE
jgi:sRNA-binding protein